jgi:hypothetical protein
MLTWLDSIQNTIKKGNPNIKYMGFSDCGFFINYKSLKTRDYDYDNRMKSLVELVNQQTSSIPN